MFRKNWPGVFIGIFLWVAVVPAQHIAPAAIDSLFADWDHPDTPGGAIGVVKDGEMVYARGYGMANLEYDIPNSPTSVFRIASLSKQFTAACVILLAQQGKLALDDPLRKFFPAFPPYAGSITVRHLLNHTSGIRDYLTLAELAGLVDDDFYTDEDVMNWLVRQKETNFRPGDEYLYSNSGYWLLGQIVNQVAGENMSEFARKQLFQPLGMNQTHFHNDHRQIVKNRAVGYAPNDKGGFRISTTTLDMIGDGGIFTTVEDLKKWDDEYYRRRFLNDDFWREMTRRGVLNNGDTIDYASGLVIGQYRGLKSIRHSGAFVGYRTAMIRFPEQRFTVIVLANRSDANPSEKAERVADLFLRDLFAAAGAEKESPQLTPVPLSPEKVKPYCGSYWNSLRSYSVTVYLENDTLRYRRSEAQIRPLIPIGERTFAMPAAGRWATVTFSEKEPRTLTVSFPGAEPFTLQAYQPANYSPEQLQAFAGRYYSEELDVFYDLRMEDGKLLLRINGKNRGAVQPVMADVLTNDRVGTFYFRRDATGEINEFRLAAGRVKNLRFEKRQFRSN